MSTTLHNNPPSAFNLEYVPHAADVSIMATVNCFKNGTYDNPNWKERATARNAEYNRLMALGEPTDQAVIDAKKYLADL